LIASAYAANVARRAAEFGVRLQGGATVDMKAVKARKDVISGKSRMGVEDWMKSLKSGTVYQAHARFLSPREIAVGNEILMAEKIFINVGGRASVPPFPSLEGVEFLTNSSMMDVDFLPEHLVIIGGSYVGLEFAQPPVRQPGDRRRDAAAAHRTGGRRCRRRRYRNPRAGRHRHPPQRQVH
jgi:pyruvate/2-oxoglutarate dehydrogenase complex dihydrolipoamide dehydrogenase (E3) component